MTKITSLQVAKRAGVSQSAVSRVFTAGASASKKTALKVREAAQELGYRPNVIARSLITGKSRIIGLVVAYLDNYFYPAALEKLSNALQKKGYHVLVFMASNAHQSKEQVIDRIASLCQDYGFFVEYMNQSSVKCQRESSTGAQIFLGTRSGSGVQSVVQFMALSPSKDTVRVNSRAWFENMNAFGGVKRTSIAPQTVDEIKMIFMDLERYSS